MKFQKINKTEKGNKTILLSDIIDIEVRIDEEVDATSILVKMKNDDSFHLDK